jgi:hypothetical protein
MLRPVLALHTCRTYGLNALQVCSKLVAYAVHLTAGMHLLLLLLKTWPALRAAIQVAAMFVEC